MKKLGLVIGFAMTALFFVTGCSIGEDLANTPTKQVESMLSKYQMLDEDVLKDLDKVVAEEEAFNTKQRDTYKKLMKKHYQDLVYEIKDERVDGDDATVEVEIEVRNYAEAFKKAEEYRKSHESEFYDKDKKFDKSLYMDYKLKQMEEAKEKVTYTLELALTKKDGKWLLDNLSRTDKEKIQGIYEE